MAAATSARWNVRTILEFLRYLAPQLVQAQSPQEAVDRQLVTRLDLPHPDAEFIDIPIANEHLDRGRH